MGVTVGVPKGQRQLPPLVRADEQPLRAAQLRHAADDRGLFAPLHRSRRVFLKNPPILILDEATSALDTFAESAVQNALGRLAKKRTTIVIAHRLTTIRNASMICYLEGGRIVECGTHDSLLAMNGRYRALTALHAAGPGRSRRPDI